MSNSQDLFARVALSILRTHRRCIGSMPQNPLHTKGIPALYVGNDETAHSNMNLRQSGPFIGLGGMATTLFLYGWSAIVRHDLESLVVLPLVWLVLFALTLAWFTRYPYRVLVLPFVAAAAWFLAMLT